MNVAVIVLLALSVIVMPLLFVMFHGMGEIRSMVIRDVDLSKLEDGTYQGSYHKGRWTYDVVVDVRDHRITSVKNINSRMDMARTWNDRAAAEIVEKQSIRIDVISGATINTKAFERAVEVALTTPPR